MAATNSAYTTGAGKDEAELRRRNVTGYETANGGQVMKLEAEDTKKLQKVCSSTVGLRIPLTCMHSQSPASSRPSTTMSSSSPL